MLRKRRCDNEKGFTLIELMIVIVIIGILATLLIPRIMERPEEARRVKAKMDIEAIVSALKLYKIDCGSYPTTDQGLSALVKKPDTPPVPAGTHAPAWEASTGDGCSTRCARYGQDRRPLTERGGRIVAE